MREEQQKKILLEVQKSSTNEGEWVCVCSVQLLLVLEWSIVRRTIM